MSRKSFTTYAPTETLEIEVNGTVFPLNNAVPGDVLLDFLAGVNDESPATVAKAVRGLFATAIQADHLERWQEFIRDPENHVTIETLMAIGEYVAEVLTGTNPPQLPAPSLGG